MVDYIKVSKGLDIPIDGAPKPIIKKTVFSETVAVKPTDFRGVIPKLMVKEGDVIKAGGALFHDKAMPEVMFTSPVSGTIAQIVRGEKRKLLEVVVSADKETVYEEFNIPKFENLEKEEIKKFLLLSGLWAGIRQRPYNVIPNVNELPKAIFISAFNTAPLAPDMEFVLKDQIENIQCGINVLKKLTQKSIHLNLKATNSSSTPFHKLANVEYNVFDGPHPAGNVGVQINKISPINKGEIVWTLDLFKVAEIGKLFSKGIYDASRVVAITGPRATEPCYVNAVAGMNMKSIAEFANTEAEKFQAEGEVRFISGNILTGNNVGKDGYLGFFDNQVSLITEGDYYEAFGWAKPFRVKKFSFAHTYFSWLTPKKKYKLDTNLNGGVRAFVQSDIYSKVFPMDILPVFLLKAILAEDIDKMEQLGIYEVVEEDFALCEYICPSKIEIQSIITKGIDVMIKEMS